MPESRYGKIVVFLSFLFGLFALPPKERMTMRVRLSAGQISVVVLLIATLAFVLWEWVGFIRLSRAHSIAVVIRNAIGDRQPPVDDNGLLMLLRESAARQVDRDLAADVLRYRENDDAVQLRRIARRIFMVVGQPEQCKAVCCVLASHSSSWACSADLLVDTESGHVMLETSCGEFQRNVAQLDGYAVTVDGDVVCIPPCATTKELSRFLQEGCVSGESTVHD